MSDIADSDPDTYVSAGWPDNQVELKHSMQLHVRGRLSSKVSERRYGTRRPDPSRSHLPRELRNHPCGDTLDAIRMHRIIELHIYRRWDFLYDVILSTPPRCGWLNRDVREVKYV